MAVIALIRRQGYPADIYAGVYPGHSSRVPAKSYVKEREACVNHHMGYGRSPVPVTVCEYPIAVVVSYVTERLMGNPDIVPAPDGPSAHGKWSPSGTHINRTPEIIVCPIIVNSFPSAMLLDRKSVV